MNSSELKDLLHEMLDDINEVETLEKVKNYFFYLKNRKKDWRTKPSDQGKESTEKLFKTLKMENFKYKKMFEKQLITD